MSDSDRPKWGFNEMTEKAFSAFYSFGMVVSVTGKREFTGADTSREWLEAKNSSGKIMTLPHGWEDVWKFVGYSCSPGLFQFTYLGERMAKQLEAIKKWEAANKRELAEFERLKKKFGLKETRHE